MAKALAIVLALAAGACCPWAYSLAQAAPWGIAVMLFIGFARTAVDWRAVRPLHLRLVLAAAGMGAVGCVSLWWVDHDLALAALLIGITPTATAAPVITAALGGEVAVVTVGVLLSHLVCVLLAPPALSLLLGTDARLPISGMLSRVALVVGTPLVAGQILRRVAPTLAAAVARLQPLTFWLWVALLFAVAANASHFVLSFPGVSFGKILAFAGISFVLCALAFALGRRLGRPGLDLEGGQMLGQKNTLLTIWMASVFASPVVALGPTFYVVWHNLFNAMQMAQRARINPARSRGEPSDSDGVSSSL